MLKIRILILFSLFCVFPVSAEKEVLLRITHGPYLQHITASEVTVVWTTNKPCKSWVEYRKKEDGNFYAAPPQKSVASQNGLCIVDTVHRVTVSGLSAATAYLYRIVSQEVKELLPYRPRLGDVVSTDIGRKPLTFTTANPQKETADIVMLCDIHGNNDRLKTLLSLAGTQPYDWAVYGGDMCSYINTQDDVFNGFLDTSVSLFASQRPFVYVRGNHETRGAFARQFPRYLAGKEGKFYYAFTYGPIYFVVLDCGEDKPDSDLEYSGLVDFDEYMKEQQRWLEQEVNSEAFMQASFRVVLSHIPFAKGGWYGSLRLRKQLLPLLEKSGVDMMLCGHNHAFSYIEKGLESSFPIIINSNNSFLRLSAQPESIKIVVTQEDGKTLFDQAYIKQQ